MQKYRLKVSLKGVSIRKLSRTIEISGNCTFSDLHEEIFEAFDRYEEHMYSFFLTRQDSESKRKIMNSDEITHPYALESSFNNARSSAETTIDDAKLKEKDVLHYWFDFGDDWWHRIRVEEISESKDNNQVVRIVEKVGKSPEQYSDDDDEDFYDDE